jgi:hypothetical protein
MGVRIREDAGGVPSARLLHRARPSEKPGIRRSDLQDTGDRLPGRRRPARTGRYVMIRARRTTLTADEVATACGYSSLRAARAAGLFTKPGFPRPLNQHGNKPGHNMIWDKEQILAHSEGVPVPAVPAADDPDDLLDAHEAAELWAISRATWDTYAIKKPHLIPEHQLVHGVKFWSRRDLTEFDRPGRGAGAGRHEGTADRERRTRLGKGERLARVTELMTGAKERGADLTAEEVVAELNISESYARRLMREAASAETA